MTQCVKYWVKLTQMPNYRYLKQCYNMLRSLASSGKINWASNVRLLLYKHGFGYVWEADTIGDASRFINLFMFSFISFRRNINYLLPRLLNFWKPDTLPRITNYYDVHAYMPQHQYLAFFVYIITVYTSLYYILKHKISKRNNIYVCDGKHRPEYFLFIHKTKFHNKKFTASQHPSFQM